MAMSNYRTFGRMYTHLMTTVASLCKDAGYSGLVLLLDEVERVDILSKEERDLAFGVLKHFAAVAMEPETLEFEPEALYKGGQQVHRELPLTFEESTPLSLVLALTPLEDIALAYSEVTKSTQYDLVLKPMSIAELPELVRGVVKIYTSAFPAFAISHSGIKGIIRALESGIEDGSSNFRLAVRSIVFELDARRLGEAA